MATASNLKEIKISRWDLGIPDEERDLANGYFKFLENFTVGDNAREIKQVGNVGKYDSTKNLRAVLNIGGVVYGLGMNGSGLSCVWDGLGQIYAAEHDPADTGAFSNIENPFFVYANGYIFFDNGNYIGRWKIDNTAMAGYFSNPGVELKGGLVWQTYLWGWSTANTIYKIDASSGAVISTITVPADQTIIELLDYGNLIAIVCTSGTGDSKMFLWDGVNVTSLPYTDIIKIGTGTVAGAGILDGVITVVIGNGQTLRIKQYTGAKFDTVYYYAGRKNTSGDLRTVLTSRVKVSKNFIYFLAEGTRPSSTDAWTSFMFRWGNKISGQQKSFCVYKNFEWMPTYGGGVWGGTPNRLNDFCILEDQNPDYTAFFCAMADQYVAGNLTIKEIYTYYGFTGQAGVLETGIYTMGDSSVQKQLKAVSLQFAPLPANAQVVLKYKKDEETSWTTIFTETTANAISHESVGIDGGNDPLPTFKEISFRVEILGNATITGFKFKSEDTDNVYG